VEIFIFWNLAIENPKIHYIFAFVIWISHCISVIRNMPKTRYNDCVCFGGFWAGEGFQTKCQSRHILRKRILKSPDLDNRFLEVAKPWHDSRKFLISSLICSQIWLIPLVDDRQSTDLTKLFNTTMVNLQPVRMPCKWQRNDFRGVH